MRPGIVSGRFNWQAMPARKVSTTSSNPETVTRVISSLPAVVGHRRPTRVAPGVALRDRAAVRANREWQRAQIVGRECGLVRCRTRDWFVVGRSAALIAAFAFSTKVTNVPSVPITLSRSVAILSIWPLVVEKNFRESALNAGSSLS
jgi:hypothetical protein